MSDVHKISETQEIDVEHVRVLLLHGTQFHSDLNAIVLDASDRNGSLCWSSIKQGEGTNEGPEQTVEQHSLLRLSERGFRNS